MPDIQLTKNLTLKVFTARYNETLDPNFDIGSDPPDMIIGCNAVLFAYKSWASVIDYLGYNNGVVGVFLIIMRIVGIIALALAAELQGIP